MASTVSSGLRTCRQARSPVRESREASVDAWKGSGVELRVGGEAAAGRGGRGKFGSRKGWVHSSYAEQTVGGGNYMFNIFYA